MNTDFYTEEELATMRPSRARWSPQQLAQHFSHCAGQAKRQRAHLTHLVFMFQDIPRTGHWHTDYQNIDAPVSELMRWRDFLDAYLKKVEVRNVVGEGGVNISRAKMVPISSFVEFNRANKAPCVWHNEKTGSMHYYPKENKVTCFGCNKNGDVLDVVQALWNCSLVEAVKKLGV